MANSWILEYAVEDGLAQAEGGEVRDIRLYAAQANILKFPHVTFMESWMYLSVAPDRWYFYQHQSFADKAVDGSLIREFLEKQDDGYFSS